MKTFVFLVLSLLVSVDPATVKKINAAKEAAEDAFKRGDYKTAIRHYEFLVDSLGVSEDAVVLNLANAYYLAKDTANAFNNYQSVAQSAQSDIRSKAHQQLGIMTNRQGKAELALSHFKQSIKAEPANNDARYNYEMLKKKLEEQKKQEEQQKQENQDQKQKDKQNQDQQNKDQKDKDQQKKDQEQKDEQNKDQQQKDQEQKDQEQKDREKQQQQDEQQQKDGKKEEMPNLNREKLEQMKISEDKARMILEAMKNQEKQYLQQQRRKPTQSPDSDKPDW